MFFKNRISFLIICLIFVLLLAGCRGTVDYSSSPVIPGEEDFTHSNDSSEDTSSEVSSSEPVPSSQTSTVTSSKPSKPSSSSTVSHLHAFKITRVVPTCTKDGYTLYECSCGETKMDSYIPKKGHSWSEWKTVSEATLLGAGLKERECTVCHEKETEQIPVLTPDYAALRTELLKLVNDKRTNALNYNTEMQAEADRRAEELIEKFEAKSTEGYSENIYKGKLSEGGEFTAKGAFDYWFDPENQNDRNNILSDEFTGTAIGVVLKDGQYYWVQIFLKD